MTFLRRVLTTLSLSVLVAAVPLQSSVGQQSPSTPPSPPAEADRQGVRQAALDYVNALYRADTAPIVRSVDTSLVKYGYVLDGNRYTGRPMSYDQLKELARTWNKDQARVNPDSARKNVVVFDVLDKTASAKVIAHWGVDYLHLVKTGEGWKIRQIIWQTHPPNM